MAAATTRSDRARRACLGEKIAANGCVSVGPVVRKNLCANPPGLQRDRIFLGQNPAERKTRARHYSPPSRDLCKLERDMSERPELRAHYRVKGPFDGRRIGKLEVPVLIYDLSEGGCFVTSVHEQAPDAEIVLEIHLPHDDHWIRVKVRSLYARSGFGFGAKIIKISDEDRQRLAAAIDKIRREAGGD